METQKGRRRREETLCHRPPFRKRHQDFNALGASRSFETTNGKKEKCNAVRERRGGGLGTGDRTGLDTHNKHTEHTKANTPCDHIRHDGHEGQDRDRNERTQRDKNKRQRVASNAKTYMIDTP